MISSARKQKWWRRAALALGASVVPALLLFFSLPTLLIRPAETRRAEAILHLAVRSGLETDAYVAELYRQGYGTQIVCLSEQLTWQVYPADFARERLIAFGIPAQNVSVWHLPRVACGAEAAPFLLKLVQEQGWKSVLVVTEPPASRALQRVYASRFAQEQMAFSVTFAPVERERFRGAWWRTHKPTQMLVLQGLETVLDFLYPHCW